jgi:hypothetical protein
MRYNRNALWGQKMSWNFPKWGEPEIVSPQKLLLQSVALLAKPTRCQDLGIFARILLGSLSKKFSKL